MTCRENGAC